MKSCPCESLWIRAYGCETSFWYYLGLNFSSINSRATNANVKITPWRGNVFSDAWVQNLLSESRGTRTTQVMFIQHVCNNSLRKQLIASLAQTLLLEWPAMLINFDQHLHSEFLPVVAIPPRSSKGWTIWFLIGGLCKSPKKYRAYVSG